MDFDLILEMSPEREDLFSLEIVPRKSLQAIENAKLRMSTPTAKLFHLVLCNMLFSLFMLFDCSLSINKLELNNF